MGGGWRVLLWGVCAHVCFGLMDTGLVYAINDDDVIISGSGDNDSTASGSGDSGIGNTTQTTSTEKPVVPTGLPTLRVKQLGNTSEDPSNTPIYVVTGVFVLLCLIVTVSVYRVKNRSPESRSTVKYQLLV